MARPLMLGALLVALSALACREPAEAPAPSPAPEVAPPPPAPTPDPAPPPQAADVRAEPAAVAAAPAPEPAAPAAPAPSAATLLRECVALDPQGPIPLSHSEETVVDPAATFRVELAAEIPDGRLVLLDAADAIVPASGTREVAATTRFTLAPTSPLVPGSRYVLRLDGARAREVQDVTGRAFAPVSLKVLVAGEPPKPEPKPAPSRRRGRR